MNTYKFSFPTLIHFGPGVRFQVADYLKANGLKRPLIVTDRGLASLTIFKDFQKQLEGTGFDVEIFSDIQGNPVKSQVTSGVKMYHSHNADSLVGFGGGSALDVTKAIALMATHPGDLFDYEDEKPTAKPIDGPIPFWIALPTTAGTGSEVGRSTVISDDNTHLKKIIFSPKLLAKAVFADPELTLELPSKITAATGMDALTHCVESYLAKGYHPICDGIALEGLRLAATSLSKCIESPHDLEARSSMLMASMMGAIAFQKGLGLTHSCAHALSTVADLHHGLANGIMINYALKFNIPTVPERFQTMVTTIGLKDITPDGFIHWLENLKQIIKIPKNLLEVGVSKNQVERLSQVAIEDSCHFNNPRPCTKADFQRIFSDALC